MEKQQKQPVMVLKYGKRRFDGGLEMLQIRMIERQQSIAKLKRMSELDASSLPLSLDLAPPAETPDTLPTALSTEDATASNAVEEAALLDAISSENLPVVSPLRQALGLLLLGPLAICIGLVGLVVAFLVLVVCRCIANPPLKAQAHLVIQECVKTIQKGSADLLTAPRRALQLFTPAS